MNVPTGPTLRDIHLPPAPGWWPPAPGWWVLAALLVVLVAWLLYRHWRLRARRRRWHQARDELDALLSQHAATDDDQAFAAGISQLLRRVARLRRVDAASAHGKQWRDVLQALAPDTASAQPLLQLDAAVYRRHAEIDVNGIASAARRWLRHVLMRGAAHA